MKKLILILLLLVAVGVGAPFWVGKQIEAQLPAYLQRAAEVGQFNIELTAYDRKLFRSTATTTITFNSVKNEKLVLQHTIWHGPLPIGQTSNGQWQFAPAAAVVETTLAANTAQAGSISKLLERLPGFAALHDLTIVALSGSTTSSFSIPPFNQEFSEDGDRFAFEWRGLNGTSSTNSDLTQIESEATIAGIKFSDPATATELNNITTTLRLHEDPSGLLLGNATLDSSTITIGPKEMAPEFSIKGLQLRNAAKLDGDSVSYAIEVAADEIANPTITFAPAGFEVLFSGLDAATILAVQHQLQQLQTDIVSMSEEDAIRQVTAIYLAALPALLQKTPEIRLNYLRAKTESGELWAKGKLSLSNESNSPITFDNLDRLIEGKGEAQISRTLLQYLVRQNIQPNMMAAWQAGQFGDISEDELNNMVDIGSRQEIDNLALQGLLIADGENYKINFAYSNSQATLNDHPLPD